MPVFTARIENGVARLVFDRPPLNIVDLATAREMERVLGDVTARDDVDVVLLEARGRVFSAGVDVPDHLPGRGEQMIPAFHAVCLALQEMAAPVVAAVHAPAIGGGCELALACDLVIAARSATFSQPEIRLGVIAPFASLVLPERIGSALAADLLLTGRALTADEALSAGIVSRVADDPGFPAAVDGLIDELRALSPSSLRIAKRALRMKHPPPRPAEIAAVEQLYLRELMNSPDAVEGLRSFMEKRPPGWTPADPRRT
jgi:cyclohexa-1,5-dienecarbonyl-CoA hydratase